MYRAKIITVSDRSFRRERKDLSGPAVKSLLDETGYETSDVRIVPDEEYEIISELKKAVSEGYELIVTTGGTGFSPRDVTPEATLKVSSREAQGIAEAMRYESMKINQRAMLSRGRAVIAEQSLIINLPGSPKGAVENLSAVLGALSHGLDMLTGKKE